MYVLTQFNMVEATKILNSFASLPTQALGKGAEKSLVGIITCPCSLGYHCSIHESRIHRSVA